MSAASPRGLKRRTAESEEKAVLYSYFRSSCSWRVRLALNLKGIPYEYKPINLLNGDHQKSEYAAINPMKSVPALSIDGHTLTQSQAIIEYLDETRPDVPLLPSNPADRAKVRAIAEIIVSDTQPVQNLRVINRVEQLTGSAEKKVEWAQHFIRLGFDAVEAELKRTAGKYCFGDHITLADLCVIPQLANARRFKVDLSAYPTILRVEEALVQHPAFVASHPDNQPDTPKQP